MATAEMEEAATFDARQAAVLRVRELLLRINAVELVLGLASPEVRASYRAGQLKLEEELRQATRELARFPVDMGRAL